MAGVVEMEETTAILQELDLVEYVDTLNPGDREGQGDSWQNWASSCSHVRCVENTVPDGILPEGRVGSLSDYKVNSRGPDDEIYDKNAVIREKVARGNTFLRLDGGSYECILYAMKKFTGGMGDDDDREAGGDDQIWKRYFTKDYSESTSVLSANKVNGEAAHLSCVKIDEQQLICTGSKNVHMLIRNESDISKYTEGRYKVATTVAQTVMYFINQLDTDVKNRLLNFLCETRLTAVFEILVPTHQHVEDLSYLGEKNVLKFITWTSTDLNPTCKLCILPPDVGVKIASHLGFETIDITEVPIAEAEAHMLQVRNEYGHEGYVLYFLDSQRNVIGLVKKKTSWYIICRAIREKIRNALCSKRPLDQPAVLKKIKSRIGEIQKWLTLSDTATETWIKLGQGFLKWCIQQKRANKLKSEDIADLFPVTWKRYLTETEQTDKNIE